MKKSKEEVFRFQLAFKGNLVENSVDAYTVANTILATSQALNQIAELKFGESAGNHIKININAFKEGSLISDFLIYAPQIAGQAYAFLPHIKDACKTGKEMLDTFKTIIDIKKELQGKRPKKVLPRNDGKVEIHFHGGNNNVTVISIEDFRAMQDKTISKSISKIAEPLLEPESEIKEVNVLEDGKKIISIDKEDAVFLASNDEIQIVPEIRYKGVVSKIDTKAYTGFLDLNKRRVSFEYSKDLPIEQFHSLVDSLRNRIQIYLTGSVEMDLESNPKKIIVVKVERDEKLFS